MPKRKLPKGIRENKGSYEAFMCLAGVRAGELGDRRRSKGELDGLSLQREWETPAADTYFLRFVNNLLYILQNTAFFTTSSISIIVCMLWYWYSLHL